MNNTPLRLSPLLRLAATLLSAIDLVVGLGFLIGPELGSALWPTNVPRELMRFIGAIIIANGVGAAMVARRATWENARVLMAVALVYGVAVLLTLIPDLLFAGAAPIFWLYVLSNAIFVLPIAFFFVRYERLWQADRRKPQ